MSFKTCFIFDYTYQVNKLQKRIIYICIYICFDQYIGLKFHLVKKYEIVYQLEGMTQQIKLTVFVIFIIRDQLNHINL